MLILLLCLLWGREVGLVFTEIIMSCSFTCPMSQIQRAPSPSQLIQHRSRVTR